MRAIQLAQRSIRAADYTLRTRFLFPVNVWLDLHHFTAIAMLLTALSLITQPATSVVKLGVLLNTPLALILAWLFTLFGAMLAVRTVDDLTYKALLLPIYLYAGISFWYAASGQAGTWQGVITQFMVIGFFWLKSTPLPKGGEDEGIHRRTE